MNCLSCSFFFFFFFFLGLHVQHMEVPRLGVNQSYNCWPTPQRQQYQIWATSATYTIAHGNTGSLTHWVRPKMEPTTSWFLVGFINHWAMMGTPQFLVFWGTSLLFSMVAESIYIPNNSDQSFLFSHIFTRHLLFLDFFNDSHSDRFEVIIHCSFNLHLCNA